MKKAIIVHCWNGHPQYCWYPYLKTHLERRGYEVEIPFFPEFFPFVGKWTGKIRTLVGEAPDQDTLLVGHSLGSVAVLKYLQGLQDGQKIGGAVLVSGFVNDLGIKPLWNFFAQPLDFQKIKARSDKFVVVASPNDPYINAYHAQVLKEGLGARMIWKKGGHFTESVGKIQFLEFPEILTAIDEIDAHDKSFVPA